MYTNSSIFFESLERMLQFFPFLLVIVLAGEFCTCEGFPNIGLRIVNGSDAKEGEFPYVVSLRIWATDTREIHWCGGSIISPRFVLTAGHCLDEQIIFARVGRIDLDDFSRDHTHSVAVKKVYLHPDYTVELNSINDLALVELVHPLTYNATIQPVALPAPNATIPFNAKVWITGWGMVNESLYEPSDILQKVQITLFSDNYCSSQLSDDYSNEVNLCAGDTHNTKGHCSGDSGGPLVVDGVQYGVISWSIKPCISAPGVYTRLSNPLFRNWIWEIAGV